MIEIHLEGKPISVNAMFKGRRFLSREGKETKERYGWQAKSQYKGVILVAPLYVEVTFIFSDNRKHDIDNCLKALFDSMTGIVWKDDNQVVELVVHKKKAKKEGIVVKVEPYGVQ